VVAMHAAPVELTPKTRADRRAPVTVEGRDGNRQRDAAHVSAMAG